jgi:hypothetical protein
MTSPTTPCPRASAPLAACPFCAVDPGEPCPLEQAPPFAGPPIGAAVGAVGECDGGDVCEACQ